MHIDPNVLICFLFETFFQLVYLDTHCRGENRREVCDLITQLSDRWRYVN